MNVHCGCRFESTELVILTSKHTMQYWQPVNDQQKHI